jgi:5-methylcytosine-specific restriction protein A
MTAVILTWDPDTWNWGGLYPTAVAKVRRSGWCLERWSIDRAEKLPTGTEAWLLVQGGRPNQRGLIGHGVTVREPFAPEHHGPPIDGTPICIDVQFDLLLPEGEQLRTDELMAQIPDIHWQSVPGSGERIPAHIEPAVRAVWAEHILDSASRDEDALDPIPGSYPESALTRVAVNRYERSPEARAVAIAHHGSCCHACGFDFEVTYGPKGAGFIQVHHTVPASGLFPDYEIDPISDLVPLCPNCHYMAHRRVSTPYTVAELRAMIAAAGHLPGTVVTAEHQEAQDAARRIAQAGPTSEG